MTVALNHEEIKEINHWEEINYLSEKDDQKKFEKNNLTIDLMLCKLKKKKIYPASKYWSPGRPEDVHLQFPQDIP